MASTELRAAAQQALEAWQTAPYGHPSHHKATLLAMTALKATLAEPNTEHSSAVEPVQEPHCEAHGECFGGECIYTAPPHRPAEPVQAKPWVGLTEDERTDICDGYGANIHWRAFRAIEAKLQEKNT